MSDANIFENRWNTKSCEFIDIIDNRNLGKKWLAGFKDWERSE